MANQSIMTQIVRTAHGSALEVYVWVAFAALAAWPFTRDLITKPTVSDAVGVRSEWLLVGCVVLLFPFLFRLIFGSLPFEALRRRVNRAQVYAELDDSGTATLHFDEPIPSPTPSYKWTLESEDMSERLLGSLSMQSTAVAKRIYSRSGVYLIVGVFIAFTGLLFFYSQTTELIGTAQLKDMVLAYTPRLGILIFIELIAFFFLRQYGAAMDEYRYYEAIQRHREELLALVVLSKAQNKPLDIQDLLAKGVFYSKANVLEKEQTTELLESRKLEKNELLLLEKMIDLIGTKK